MDTTTTEVGRFDFTDGHAELVPRAGYLHVVEHGFVGAEANMRAYCEAVVSSARRDALDCILVDTRDTSMPDPTAPKWADVRRARWDAMAASELRWAFVMPDEMAATRVSMSARSFGVAARGFVQSNLALRWLKRGDTMRRA